MPIVSVYVLLLYFYTVL